MDKTTKEVWMEGKNISPEALEKRKKINKKIFKFGCLPIVIIIILISLFSRNSSDSEANDNSTVETTEVTKYIKGLAPVDVYLNMEKQGFTTDKNLSGEYGNSWSSKKSIEGIDYIVETYSSNIDNVESVKATAIIDLTIKNIESTKQFLKFVATLPYDNAKPQEASDWIENNFNKDKSNITFGDVKMTIYAPSKAARMLIIETSRL